ASEAARSARSEFSRLGLPYESAQASLIEGLASMGLARLEAAEKSLGRARDAFARAGNKVLTAHVDSYLAELALRRGDYRQAWGSAAGAPRPFSARKQSTQPSPLPLLAAPA